MPFILLALLLFAGAGTNGAEPEAAAPAESGMPRLDIAAVDRVVERLIADRNTPGAVVAIGRTDELCFLKAYGRRQEYPSPEPMTTDTIFDLASVTKTAATGLCVNILLDRGKIELDAPAARYLPEFTGKGKEKITVKDLLLHVSGMEDHYYEDFAKGIKTPDAIWKNVCETGLKSKPGERYEYSCQGYVVLGKIVERVSGESLPDFARKNIYEPLGMKDTGFTPGETLRPRVAPTNQRDGKWKRGDVNDGRSYYMGGRVGNAGLFSTAPDLARLARVLLRHGVYQTPAGETARLFSEETFQKMTASYSVPALSDGSGARGLSWDKKTGKPNLPPDLSPHAIGHGGYTGTSLFIDPDRNLFVIVLTTRLHLDPAKPNIYPAAGEIAALALAALEN